MNERKNKFQIRRLLIPDLQIYNFFFNRFIFMKALQKKLH